MYIYKIIKMIELRQCNDFTKFTNITTFVKYFYLLCKVAFIVQSLKQIVIVSKTQIIIYKLLYIAKNEVFYIWIHDFIQGYIFFQSNFKRYMIKIINKLFLAIFLCDSQ